MGIATILARYMAVWLSLVLPYLKMAGFVVSCYLWANGIGDRSDAQGMARIAAFCVKLLAD